MSLTANPKKLLLLILTFCFNPLFSQIDIIAVADRKLSLSGEAISQGRVKALVEDNEGLIWIGTLDGLNCYDGYSTQIFRHITADTNGISNNIINDLCVDHNGDIWIATNYGLNKYSTKSRSFTQYMELDKELEKKDANKIIRIEFDDDGKLWLATGGTGIVLFDTETLSREYISLNIQHELPISQSITELSLDKEGNPWFSNTDGEICCLLRKENSIVNYPIIGRKSKTSNEDFINALYVDNNGKLWIAITGQYEGIYYFNKDKKAIVEVVEINDKMMGDKFISSLRTITCIVNDKEGNLWFSSHYLGIFKVDKDFNIICYPDHDFDNLLNYSELSEVGGSILLWGSTGILWIGTNGYGLEYIQDFNFLFNTIKPNGQYENFNIRSVRAFEEDKDIIWIAGYYNLFAYHKNTGKYYGYIAGGSYYSLCNNPMNNDELFVGTEGGGLGVFNKKTNTYVEERELKTISGKEFKGINVYELKSQDDSILWIGRNNGLEKRNLLNNTSEYIPLKFHEKEMANLVSIISSYIDENGEAWFGSLSNGVLKYNKQREILESVELRIEQSILSPRRINSIYKDARGNIWLCSDKGIFVSDSWDKEFKLINIDDGLVNDFVYASIEDDFGNLWFSTNNGLSKWNPEKRSISNYLVSTDLHNNEFNTGAFFKDKEGFIYFGGTNGFTYFKPEIKDKSKRVYPFVLRTVSTNLGELFPNATDKQTYSIKLDKGVHYVKIEFSLLSFLNENLNNYQYRNLNNDSNWIDLRKTNKFLIDKPASGKQIVELRASTSGTDSYQKKITIILDKEYYFYQTIIFWITTVLTIAVLIFIFVRWRIWKSVKQQNKLEYLVNLKTRELQDINEELTDTNLTKDRLFSIIAHDLRSPLNSLLGFSSLLEEQGDHFTNDEKREFASVIHLSSKNLNDLLDNLLNWSRLQMNKIVPDPQIFELESVINSNLDFLDSNMKQKRIHLLTTNLKDVFVKADADMISVIIRNLLSNAIKFTNDNGNIHISVTPENEYIVLSIKDSGIGIPKDKIDDIFNIETTTTTKGTNNEVGTGLGLILCQDFAKLNKGRLRVSSVSGEGSDFKLYLLKP